MLLREQSKGAEVAPRQRFAPILLLAGLAASLMATAAQAAPEEIQVYMDEMDDPGEIGLDTHVNYVLTGLPTDDYPGEQQSLHRLRVTPEFSYGITRSLEAGLYLPLATLDRDGHAGVYGVKGRLKYIAHRREGERWWYGANFELGHVVRRLDINPWNAELKGIVGTRQGRWTLAFNLNLDFVVSGPQPSPASLDGDTKISYAVAKTFALGVESYNGLGDVKRIGRFGDAEQTIFATADKSFGKWDLNIGIGRGYGANPDRLLLKAIIGVPIDGLFRHRRGQARAEAG